MTTWHRVTDQPTWHAAFWCCEKEGKKERKTRGEGRKEGGSLRYLQSTVEWITIKFLPWWADYAVVALRWTLTCVCQWLVTVKQQHKRQELSQEAKNNQLLLLFLIGIQEGRKEMNECHCTKERRMREREGCNRIVFCFPFSFFPTWTWLWELVASTVTWHHHHSVPLPSQVLTNLWVVAARF